MSRMMRFRSGFSATAIVLICVGCSDTPRTETVLRLSSVESLWDTLQESYPYIEVNESLKPYKDFALQQVHEAKTTREYIVALSLALSLFSDPHIDFKNLKHWWKEKEGTDLELACLCYFSAGDYHWLVCAPNKVVALPGQALPPPQAAYQLRSVDGVPASSLALSLLSGEPGSVISVNVIALDGNEYQFGLAVPAKQVLPSATQPASQPGSVQVNISNPPGVTIAPIAGFMMGSFGKGGVASMRIGHIGYIALDTLAQNDTVPEFDKALDGLLDTSALVLDLRWNGGGNLNVTTQVLGRFTSAVTPYVLFQKRVRGHLIGTQIPIWYSFVLPVGPRGRVYHKPIVVLIENTTISAAELLACALKDIRGALLIGNRTAGAGAALACISLPDGLALQYSQQPLRRLSGYAYQYTGITPDIAIELDRPAVCNKGLEAVAQYYLETFQRGIREANRLSLKWAGPPTSQPASKPTN